MKNSNNYILKDQAIIKFDVRTKGGRIYKKQEFIRHRKFNNSFSKSDHYISTVLRHLNERGEDGLVSGEILSDDSTMYSLMNVSHMLQNFKIVDDLLLADVKLLETPQGKILKSLHDNNILLKTHVFRPRLIEGREYPDGEMELDSIGKFDAIRIEEDEFRGIIN